MLGSGLWRTLLLRLPVADPLVSGLTECSMLWCGLWFWFTWHVEWSVNLCSRLVVSFSILLSDWFFFLASDWLNGRKWRLLIGLISWLLIGSRWNTSQSFYHPLISKKKQKLLTLREAHDFTRCVTRSLVLCVCFVDRCLSFVLFLLAIVLSVLQYTDSDYPFDYLQTLPHTRCLVGSVLLIYLVFLLYGVPNVGSVSWLSFLVFITFL